MTGSNYPPGVTGSEPEISGVDPQRDFDRMRRLIVGGVWCSCGRKATAHLGMTIVCPVSEEDIETCGAIPTPEARLAQAMEAIQVELARIAVALR